MSPASGIPAVLLLQLSTHQVSEESVRFLILTVAAADRIAHGRDPSHVRVVIRCLGRGELAVREQIEPWVLRSSSASVNRNHFRLAHTTARSTDVDGREVPMGGVLRPWAAIGV
jgi:hypothetical protein